MLNKQTIVTLAIVLLAGCAAGTKEQGPARNMKVVKPNQVIMQKVPTPVLPSVATTYGLQNDPSVVAAYEKYKKSGTLSAVKSQGTGFLMYPYTADFKPIIACSTDHFCIIQLEAGEKLNSYGLGDTQNWKSSVFKTGEGPTASLSVELKPVVNGLATDMTISTNKRTYLIGLVAKAGADTTVLRFYYPDETILENTNTAEQIGPQGPSAAAAGTSAGITGSQVISSTPNGTMANLGNINFNYQIKGDSPVWRPLRVWDDGNKTYIEMSSMVSKGALPVLYLAQGKSMEMVNYRYEQPYFVVDGIFYRAWLISGKGSEQQRVEVINNKISQ